MDSIDPNPKLVRQIVDGKLLVDDPFTLVDVGCALGIDQVWRLFDDQLIAYAFDPQTQECERLSKQETHPAVYYFAKFIGLPENHLFVRKKMEDEKQSSQYYNPLGRSSALAAMARKKNSVSTEYAAAVEATEIWKEADLDVEKISIEDFVRQRNIMSIDLIKIDTDGADLEVALSSQDIIRPSSVLGYLIETPFHGTHHDTANSMHNIDRFMKEQGFMLYSMTQNRYSRAALPSTFLYRSPYQTVSGQPVWGDFLYLRDGASDDYHAIWGSDLSVSKVLKLACLYELFCLPDCAAELIVKFRSAIADLTDPEVLLDRLTPPLDGRQLRYAEYVAEFERSFETFYPAVASQGSASAGSVPQLQEELHLLRQRVHELEQAVNASGGALVAPETALTHEPGRSADAKGLGEARQTTPTGLEDAFSFTRRVIHNAAVVSGDGPFVISTPADRWGYAVELPVSEGPGTHPNPVVVWVSLTVMRGTVRVGCIGQDEDFVVEAQRTPADGETTIALPLASLTQCRSLVFRNGPSDGVVSEARVWSISVREHALPA